MIWRLGGPALVLCFSWVLSSCGPSGKSTVTGEAASFPRTPVSWADSVILTMSLEEKVGQLLMVGAQGHYLSRESDEYDRLVRLVRDRGVGGLILWQSDVYEAAILLNRLQGLAKIPLLVSADLERGLGHRVRRGTPLPDAMALGATRSPALAYAAGRIVAEEARAIGVRQAHAPVVDVNTNPGNPVINTRSFGDELSLVNAMASAFIRGLQEGRVVATAKHFPGHGDTGVDSHLDLPVITFGRPRLDSLELASFRTAVDSGVISVMAGHLAIPALGAPSDVPASLSPAVVEGVLRGDLKFKGLIVTDALEMRGVVRGFSIAQSVVMAVKAGVDVVLLPPEEEVAFTALLGAVRSGEISNERLNASLRRILAVKEWLGLDRTRVVDLDSISVHVATKSHWSVAKEIARRAITVLRNGDRILPLQASAYRRPLALVISDTEDGRSEVNRPAISVTNEQVGSYFAQQMSRRIGSIEVVRLTPASNAADFDAALLRVKRADLILAPMFVKVRTSSGRIGIPENIRGFLLRVEGEKAPVIMISFGNPYLLGSFPRVSAAVCAYGDTEVSVEAAAEALFGEIEVSGKLPVTIAGLYPYGSGLAVPKERLLKDDPVLAGFDRTLLRKVDDIVLAGIRDSAFSAAQVAVVKDGLLVYRKSFGTYSYEYGSREIDGNALFDLASLTKVIATTAAVMKLYDRHEIGLDDPVGKYLSPFAAGDKSVITIRHLLLHRGGFPPFRKFYEFCTTPGEMLDSVYATALVARPGDSTIYSDLGMITLGRLVEHVTGMSLASYVKRELYDPLGMQNTMFNPPHALWQRVVATEYDPLWRKALIRGTVHDENAALLGGVSGHAGLFSTAGDLAVFMQMVMGKGVYGGTRYFSEQTVFEFTGKKQPGGERMLGWDLKSSKGSSAGDLFSESSFGHTGFTGTSIWVDPERDLFVVFLTNRVHPTRANVKLFKIRPVLHDAVIRALAGRPRRVGQ